MFFKKMAMAVLTVGFIAGIWMQPVSVAAMEEQTSVMDVTENVDADSAESAKDTEEIKDTEDTVISGDSVTEKEQVQNTAAPVATPKVVKVTANVAVTSGKKTNAASVTKKKTAKKYTQSELRLMASIINCEAGGESYQGQVAVGIVVMNRVKSKAFPNTIKKVIYQKGQFSPVRNGMLRKKLKQYDAGKIHSAQWKSCIKAAKKALNGQTTIKLKGKTKSMKGVRFFSVYLSGAKFRLGGHRFR